MWPYFWFFILFGIRNHIVRSDAVDSEDSDVSDGDDTGFTESRRAYGEYANSRSNQPQCPSVSVCQLIAGPLNAIRNALTELEATSNTYCGQQPSIARFQPMNFPPFPSMDFMQVPSFPPFPPFMMSPPKNPVVNPPLANPSPNYPPSNYPPYSEQQLPTNPQEPPEPSKVNSGGNPWSVFTGTQKHKKIKLKICNPRRSGSGKKKHAAATAPLKKPPGEEKEKNEVTTELDAETNIEDNARDAPSTISETEEPVVNDEKEERIDLASQ